MEVVYEVYKEAKFTYNGVYVEYHRYITPVKGNKNLLNFERYLRSLLAAEYDVIRFRHWFDKEVKI